MQIQGRVIKIGGGVVHGAGARGRSQIINSLAGWVVVVILLFGGLAIPAVAADVSSSAKEGKEPWRVAADELKYDRATDQYIGKGNVTISQAGKQLTADFVRFDQKTMNAFARGHVVLNVGGDIITGDSVEIDLNTETGTIYNGTIFYKEKHFYIRGSKINKVGPETFSAEKISVTTCDGPSPDWKLTGTNVKLTNEGFGSVSNAALWVKGVPVLWAPYLVFPTKRKRQSGLLLPEFDASDRLGFQYIQPLYWAINENTDATFYGQVFSKRGFKLGGEYRYMLDDWSKGTLMADYWRDSKVDDGQGTNTADWGYSQDNVLRTNQDRYWVRGKADQMLPYQFSATVDIDFVSDQDYLREIRDQMTGYHDTRDALFNTFGRDIDDFDDPVRINQVNVRRNWGRFSLETAVRWNDDSRLRNSDAPDNTLQYLPFIDFSGSKQQVFETPFYYKLGTDFNYFYREDGESGLRADAYPRLYLPLRYRHFFTLEPSVGVRGTAYHVTQFGELSDALDDNPDRDQTRGIYDVGADLKTEVFRVFQVGGKRVQRIKHQFRPRVVYGFVPEVDQDDLPDFSSIDRIGKKNFITYSLTNTLTSKLTKSPKKKKNKDGQIQEIDNNWDYEYRRFFWFFVEQTYDFTDGDDGLVLDEDDEDYIGPFMPIHAEIELTPFKYLALQGEVDFDVYDTSFVKNGVALRLSDYRRDQLFVEHRRKKDDYHSIFTSLLINVNDRLWLNGQWEQDLEDNEKVSAGGGLLYQSQCWAFRFNYTSEQEEDRLTFMFDLTGIGGVGQSLGVGGLGQESSIVQ